VRSKPVEYISPAHRTQRVTTIIERHHYHHPYSYYYSQPTVYVGGGYSSAFWWIMMSEWSAERRADWLYHNRYRISQDAYNQGVRDAQVQARLAALERQNVARNSNYVDQDFQGNPDLMYDQSYVEAAYNPTVITTTPGGGWAVLKFLFYTTLVVAVIFGIYFLFTARFGK
jgi:hypothetical protein